MTPKYTNATSKVKTLIDSINDAVMRDDLRVGDNLLSINDASAKYKVSRDTVFKAYNELKRLGVIDSMPQKGYFVKGDMNRILLLLDNYSSFKQNLYHSFTGNLPDNYKVDLFFHQYNEHLFETIIRESVGKYSMYVVMNFSNDKFSETLKAIPASKLLLLDFGDFDKTNYSYICQDFGEAFYSCLNEAKAILSKYTRLSFLFPEDVLHPVSTIAYFLRFCSENKLDSEVIRSEKDWRGVQAGTVYFCINVDDMVRVIKNADDLGFIIGENIGLIAYNDDPILDVIKNGISSISIDFGLMGEKAAKFVSTKKEIKEYLPTKLTIRKSV